MSSSSFIFFSISYSLLNPSLYSNRSIYISPYLSLSLTLYQLSLCLCLSPSLSTFLSLIFSPPLSLFISAFLSLFVSSYISFCFPSFLSFPSSYPLSFFLSSYLPFSLFFIQFFFLSFFFSFNLSFFLSSFLSFSMEPIMDNGVQTLSGGELQRCAIVLCLGTAADIYLVDEPSAYLDSEQRIAASKVTTCRTRIILNILSQLSVFLTK